MRSEKKQYQNLTFFLGNLKIEKRPENEREKRPAHEGPALGVRIQLFTVLKQPPAAGGEGNKIKIIKGRKIGNDFPSKIWMIVFLKHPAT